MIEAFINTLEFFPRGLVYVGLGLVILLLAKLANDLMTRHSIKSLANMPILKPSLWN